MSQYYQPRWLTEALKIKKETPARILAGGTDFIIQQRKNNHADAILDLSQINELKQITKNNNELSIGSMVTMDEIISALSSMSHLNFLIEALKSIGSVQIRNRATLGGNICNASPAADSLPPLVCLDAQVKLASMTEHSKIVNRTVLLSDFIAGPGKIKINDDEIVEAVQFKLPSDTSKNIFVKIGRRNAMAISRISGALMMDLDHTNTIEKVSCSFGAVFPKPMRLTQVENYLTGKKPTNQVIDSAAELLVEIIKSENGIRKSSAYKFPACQFLLKSMIHDLTS